MQLTRDDCNFYLGHHFQPFLPSLSCFNQRYVKPHTIQTTRQALFLPFYLRFEKVILFTPPRGAHRRTLLSPLFSLYYVTE